MLTKAALNQFITALCFGEIRAEFTAKETVALLSNDIIAASETLLKLVTPWVVATAMTSSAAQAETLVILTVPITLTELFLLASVLQLLQRYLPEIRKLLLIGISERIAADKVMAVWHRALDEATEPAGCSLLQLTSTMSKQLCAADLHPQTLLNVTAEQLHPALMDMLGGLVYSCLYFDIATTLALLGYIGLNFMINAWVSWFCGFSQQKNQLMVLQNHYHTQSYALLNHAVTIELHQRRSLEIYLMQQHYTQYRQLKLKISRLERVPSLQYISLFLFQLGSLAILYLHHLNTLPTSQVVFLFIYLTTLGAQFANLSQSWRSIDIAQHGLRQLTTFIGGEQSLYRRSRISLNADALYQPLLDTDAEEPLAIYQADHALVWRHISFGYQPGQLTLHDISFQIRRGAQTAIVGSSQCGKSTMTRLVLGLLAPQPGGEMTLFGTPYQQLTKPTRYKTVHLVSQNADEGLFLDESVAYNILYAHSADDTLLQLRQNPEFLLQKDQQSLQTFYLSLCQQARISHLAYRPTCQGLSGGEKQRLKIARALASDAPIIIFDEATSQLDARTETAVMQHLQQCLRNRTLIFITHQLASIRHCEQILVFKATTQGTVLTEQGNHTSLLQQAGEYASLWELQNQHSYPMPR